MQGKEDPNTKIGEKSRMDLHGEFWALKNVNFEVQKGDRIGIIGRNGAGKSTLLKLLSRVTSPTGGTIRVRGRVASLLEVGTGFHPELTGRENVFLNGAILGMKRREIQSKFDEILNFSGVERFIDTPVKRYSSGMYVRLAFSVAAHLESEIMIIDEVLAVGDSEFQKKCLGKMDAVSRGEGRTIIFVSHHLPSIRALCNKGIYLGGGQVLHQGEMSASVDQYLTSYKTTKSGWEGQPIDLKGLKVLAIALSEAGGKAIGSSVDVSSQLRLRFSFLLKEEIYDLVLGFVLFNYNHDPIYRSLTTDLKSSINREIKQGVNTLECEVPVSFLAGGEYFLNVHASISNSEWIINPAEDRQFELKFELQNDAFGSSHHTHGSVAPGVQWELLKS